MTYLVTLYGKGVSMQEECSTKTEALRTLSRLWRELSVVDPNLGGFISRSNYDTIAILENARYRNLESKVPFEARMMRKVA